MNILDELYVMFVCAVLVIFVVASLYAIYRVAMIIPVIKRLWHMALEIDQYTKESEQ